jgi:PAS domain-containing protein
MLVEALWTGVEVAGRVALAILQYSVTIAWRAINLLGKGAAELAGYAWKGFRVAWDLLRATYEHVLKPAWQFFFRWVDKVERWLERTFGPLMRWLRRLRDWVLKFYATYIRPILDIIDISRRALRVLASLGLDWARTLDQKLADLEEKIEKPFRALVAKINDVINVVNRIMTADGLFQRLTYIRTLQRDWNLAWKTLVAGYTKPVTDTQRAETAAKTAAKSQQQVTSDVRAYMRDGSGPDAGLFSEMAAQWRKQLQAK